MKKNSLIKIIVCVIIVIFLYGCSNSCRNSFRSSDFTGQKKTDKIIGLPLIAMGIHHDASCLIESENDIDKKLKSIWEDQYIPISKSKTAYSDCVGRIQKALSSYTNHYYVHSDVLSMTINEDLCRRLMENSGARYAVVPKIAPQNFTLKSTIHMIYFVPAGPIVIYGALPIPIATGQDEMPVFTLSLLDLETKTIVAEEIFASKKKINEECMRYPVRFISDIKN